MNVEVTIEYIENLIREHQALKSSRVKISSWRKLAKEYNSVVADNKKLRVKIFDLNNQPMPVNENHERILKSLGEANKQISDFKDEIDDLKNENRRLKSTIFIKNVAFISSLAIGVILFIIYK